MKYVRHPVPDNQAATGCGWRGYFRKLATRGVLVAVFSAVGSSTAEAAVRNWVGGNGGGPTNWGEPGNWSGNLPPNSIQDQATFGNLNSTGAVDLGAANRTVGGFTFNGAVNTTITSASQTLTVSDTVVDCFVNVVGGSHAINAVVTGTGGLRLKGAGSLTFGNAVTTAALAIGSMEDANNPSYSGTVTFSGNVQTAGATFGDRNLNGASPLTLVIGGNLTDFGDIVLATGITVRATTGSHRIDETDSNGTTYVSNVTFDGPGDLTISNAVLDGPEGLPTQATYRMNGTGKVLFEGLDGWQPGMGLIKAGSGTMEIQNAAGPDYTGNTQVSAGTLLVTQPAALSGYLTGKVSVLSGATLAVRADVAGEQWTATELAGLVATGSFASGSSVGIEVNTGTFTYATNLGTTQTAKGLVKSGAGTLSLTGANTFTGNTRVTGGTLALGNVNALQSSTLDTSGGGSVTFTAAGNQTYNLGGLKGGGLLNAGANSLRVGSNGESTVSTGGITAAALTKEGAGTLTLTGPQNYATLTTTAGAGATIVNTAIGTGTTAVVANGNIRFGTVSQRFASLTIGAGAKVTFTSGVASFADEDGKGAAFGGAVAVPEPGALGLLLVGALGLVAARRRHSVAG